MLIVGTSPQSCLSPALVASYAAIAPTATGNLSERDWQGMMGEGEEPAGAEAEFVIRRTMLTLLFDGS